MKLRFASPQGVLCVDDLWDLPLTSRTNRANLDDIARSYSRELKTQGEESFVVKPARKDKVLQLGFEIIKHIIDVRLTDNKAVKLAGEKAEKKTKLLALLAKKQDDKLGDLSEEDLLAQIEALS